MVPSMTVNERIVLRRYLDQSTNYSEFGSGGSTLWADMTPSIQTIISVESDPDFRNNIQSQCERAKVYWANIGAVKDYGHPRDSSSRDLWPNYSSFHIGTPDTVLIDGRFRVACALQVFMKYPDATVLFHDYTGRPEYHVIEEFVDRILTMDTLVVVKRKTDVSVSRLTRMYEQYKYEDN